MPEATVNIEIYCDGCNAGLCSNATFTIYRGSPTFTIEPCRNCLDKAVEAGYQEGYDDAKNERKGGE